MTTLNGWFFINPKANMSEVWNLKQQFLDEVQTRGGWINCHAHFDKSFYITRETLRDSMVDMEIKWRMSDHIKVNDRIIDVEARIGRALDTLIAQGVEETVSFIDAFANVGTKMIDAARNVQEKYKDTILFKTIAHPIAGLTKNEADLKAYEEVAERADIIGGLPSADRPQDGEHLKIIFSIAKNANKPIHIHIDQENNPKERDTEKVIKYTKEFGYEGRVAIVHALSISAQDRTYRERVYKELADAGIAVIVCPSAALSMKQLKYDAPLHNSIANVPEMLDAGVVVGLGVDNMCDYYQPFVDGDMWVEMRMLMEANRFYDFDKLVEIATTNGKKIIAMK